MPYELAFQAEGLIEPRIPASKLRGSSHHTKIKLLAAGFRLVDDVRDRELLVPVVAVGKRERNAVYRQADQRREDFAAPPRA